MTGRAPGAPDVRAHVFYAGDVQGVGFRWRTTQVADGHDVTGWVKNLADGRVELVVEGERAAVEDFLADVAQRLGAYVERAETAWEPASGEFTDFSIGR